jgi:uncharacterized protein YndB with AHSA1/START domain
LSDLELLRFVQAPRAAVWRAFTDVDRFNSWFWPPRLSPLTVLDARQGGSWRVSSSVAEMAVGGTYGEMRDMEQIDLTWQWDGEAEVTEVTLRLDDDDERATILRVEHRGFGDEARRAEHEQGWSDCLDRLPSACGSL